MATAVQLQRKPPGGDLHGYLFVDAKHVREWMSQAFVNDEGYSLRAVAYKPSHCCGDPIPGSIRVHKTWATIKEALKDNLERYYPKGKRQPARAGTLSTEENDETVSTFRERL